MRFQYKTKNEEKEITLEELEKMARSGDRIPDELSPAGRIFYLGLFRLCGLRKMEAITESEYEATKKRLYSEYEVNEFNFGMWADTLKKQQAAEQLVAAARKEKSFDKAMEAIDILYGLKQRV